MKKRIKSFLTFVLVIFAINFVFDYVVARTSDAVDERFCKHWYKNVPLSYQLMLAPGISNACLDKGYLP